MSTEIPLEELSAVGIAEKTQTLLDNLRNRG